MTTARPGRITSYTRGALRFDVLDEGPLDGAPVVLLHGFPERSTCWRDVAPLLHAQGLRTFAPDQRGYSPGARPFGRWRYRIGALSDDVVALDRGDRPPGRPGGPRLGRRRGLERRRAPGPTWCAPGRRCRCRTRGRS